MSQNFIQEKIKGKLKSGIFDIISAESFVFQLDIQKYSYIV